MSSYCESHKYCQVPKSSEIRKRSLFRFYNFISFVILRALNKNSEVENSKY